MFNKQVDGGKGGQPKKKLIQPCNFQEICEAISKRMGPTAVFHRNQETLSEPNFATRVNTDA